MTMNRRDALKTLALTAGAATLGGALRSSDALAQMSGTGGATKDTTASATLAAPTGPFTLPPLPYPADALEPHLDARTMQIHHDLHHAAYVNNLNKAVADKPDLAKMTVEQLLKGISTIPENVRTVVRNHGGGHANHSLLWTSLSKSGAREPQGALKTAIDSTFGDFGKLQDGLKTAAATVFGSGWAWLSTDGKGVLKLEYTANQDSPLMVGRIPLLGIDVWEHAYYLKFQNKRADYVNEFLQVVDWGVVSTRFTDSQKG